MLDKPSDIGFSDKGFEKTDLHYHQHIIPISHNESGMLFPMQASTLQERIIQRRNTVAIRCEKAAELVNGIDDMFLIWCDRNDESSTLKRIIRDSVEVTGSDSPDRKSQVLNDFCNGRVNKLISKPSIAGFGMNMQKCNKMAFVGLSDSYEALYQAVRRCHRFGQKKDVHAHIIVAETEGNVLQNIKRKDDQAKEMKLEMLNQMKDFQSQEVHATNRVVDSYVADQEVIKPLFKG